MIINHDGQNYEIENWDEFTQKLLNAIGFQLSSEIRKEIDSMSLVQSGLLRMSLDHEVKGNELTVTSGAPYAVYLEYGTYDFWKKFGTNSFPPKPVPKKKDMTRKQASKLPKGMAPFAPFRRTLWNQNKMAKVIDKAVKVATR
jgi:hypothetical protein